MYNHRREFTCFNSTECRVNRINFFFLGGGLPRCDRKWCRSDGVLYTTCNNYPNDLLTPWISPFWKPSVPRLTKKILRSILWNPNVHYRVYNSPPPVPILRLVNPIHYHQNDFLKIHFNIILPSTSGSSKWPLSLQFPHQDICMYLSSPTNVPLAHILWPADSINSMLQLVSPTHEAVSM